MTCAQAGAGVRKLKAAGIDRPYTQSTGWITRGHDGLYPTRFPIEARLGGETGFRHLLAEGKALGYHMSVHDNWSNAYTISPDFHWDRVIHGLDGLPRIVGYWGGGLMYSHWGLAIPEEEIRKTYRQIKDLGVSGVHYLDGNGAPLMRNYHPAHRGTRAQYGEGQALYIKIAREIFGACASETGFLFNVLPSDLVAGPGNEWVVSRFSPEWGITNMKGKLVPLWYLTLHGLLGAESHGEDWTSAMNCVSLGLIPRTEWAMEPGIMPVLDDELVRRMKAKNDLCVKTFGRLVPLELTQWKRLGEKATASTFSDGTEVIADHESRTLQVNGKAIPRPEALA